MQVKRTFLSVLALSAATGLIATGCGSDDDGGESAKPADTGAAKAPVKKDIKIAFTTITLADHSFVRLDRAAKAEAERQGVEIVLQNPNGDPVAQANAVETFTQQGVDAIIFDAIDPNGIQPALRAAQAQGIPVIAVDEVLAKVDFIDSSAGIDNFAVGRQLGEELAKQVGDEEARVGIVQTIDAPIENSRVEGFKAAIKGHPNIKIVGRADAKFNLDRAANGAENLITKDPKLNWFYSTGGIYGEGIVSAIGSQNKRGEIKMIGWDITKALVEPIRDGTYVMAAQQDFEAMGKAAVDAAVKLAEKKSAPRFNTVPAHPVTKDNLEKFLPQVK